ncbi:MAG: hypothetical protein ACRETW_03025, partial [Stenotrophobium sp.]
ASTINRCAEFLICLLTYGLGSNGDFAFVRWIAQANGVNGRFEFSGIDRLRLRDGLVAENIIRFDTARLHAMLGRKPSWAA